MVDTLVTFDQLIQILHQCLQLDAVSASTLLDCLEESTASSNTTEAVFQKDFHSTRIFINNILYYHILSYHGFTSFLL